MYWITRLWTLSSSRIKLARSAGPFIGISSIILPTLLGKNHPKETLISNMAQLAWGWALAKKICKLDAEEVVKRDLIKRKPLQKLSGTWKLCIRHFTYKCVRRSIVYKNGLEAVKVTKENQLKRLPKRSAQRESQRDLSKETSPKIVPKRSYQRDSPKESQRDSTKESQRDLTKEIF